MKHLKIILLLLATFGSTTLYAQLQGQAKIDSLLKVLPRQKEDTSKVNVLCALSACYYAINADEGIKYGQQALNLATMLAWTKGMGDANSKLGLNYMSGKNDYHKGKEYYLIAMAQYKNAGHTKGIAAVTANIGLVYMNLGDDAKALEYYLEALKINEEKGYKQYAANVTGNIGIIYDKQGDFPKALEYLQKALTIKVEMGDKNSIALTYGNIGRVYQEMKDYDNSIAFYFNALKLNEELGNKKYLANIYNNIGNVYGEMRNYNMALEYITKSIELAEEIKDYRGKAYTLLSIGDLYLSVLKDTSLKAGVNGAKVTRTSEPASDLYHSKIPIPNGKAALLRAAFDNLHHGFILAKEINERELTVKFYVCLSKAYELSGDYKKAKQHSDSARAITDSFFSKETSQKIAKIEEAHKLYADSLKAAVTQKAAEIKATHRRNYELIGGGVIVLLLGFAFFITRNRNLLSKEKQQSETLLHNILPEEVAAQLKDTGKSAARQFDSVSVMFTDFVNFTEASERMKPEVLIEELDTCFKAFDEITTKYNIEKIKTIGDAYLAVCGLPTADPLHAENVIKAAIEIVGFMENRLAKMGSDRTFAVRIGIHSGSVVAGIVGVKKFAYDIWGDTVNTAARMEQRGQAGKINISQTTYELVKDKFSCEYRGEVEAKGKGVMKMYFVS